MFDKIYILRHMSRNGESIDILFINIGSYKHKLPKLLFFLLASLCYEHLCFFFKCTQVCRLPFYYRLRIIILAD